ncbi:MAG: DNA cytosine methyltransferase [Anaerolineae bacterium]|nr:DNA cytosine methyltransferase [Anaerolineae bacterium]
MNDSRIINKPIVAIDLFCGAGGSSYGARLAGVQLVAAFDMWQPAVATYNANFGNIAQCEDIREVDPESLKAEIGQIDLIMASPECTNHSRAKGKGERCETSRDTAFEVIRFASVFLPRWIVIENVVEMRQWSRYQELKERLKELGYDCVEEELNAQDFGVPQSRRRLFLICSKEARPEVVASNETLLTPARTIISDNGYRLSPLRSEKRAKATLAKVDYAIAKLKEEDALEPFLIVYYGSAKDGGSGGWQSLDKPLRTITTLDRFGYVIPGKTREDDRMRMLQPSELKRAMGYGDDFQFAEEVTRRDKIKLMGNGVCPPVMKAIVSSLIKDANGFQVES